MNVKELLSNAYKDAQIKREDGDEITSNDFQRALRQLNNVVRSINNDKNILTYITNESFNLVPGQEVYNVNFIDIEVLFFLLGGTLRYVIYRDSIGSYFNRASVTTVSGVPTISYMEPKPDYTVDLHIYMPAVSNWELTIKGYRGLPIFALNDDISVELDPYLPYLTYAIGVRLRQVMSMDSSLGLSNLMFSARQDLLQTKVIDTRLRTSLKGKGRGKTWADVNIGRGWYPRG